MEEIAAHGLAGASTNEIARAAGVSQPYVFQLFGTKKNLFLEVVKSGFDRTRTVLEDAGRSYEAGAPKMIADCNSVLDAMGQAYMRLLSDRTLLLVQLQAYAACSDADVQRLVRTEFGRLRQMAAKLSGATAHEIQDFLAQGMLLNVAAAVNIEGDPTAWSLEGLGGAT
jgi:AcrR family transcriptional regulator